MEVITVRAYTEADLPEMAAIWNEVVEEGIAFPQEESLSLDEARVFFASQTRSAVAVRQSDGKVLGLYILHPNNVGRCGHICNASYAVSSASRGLRIGEKLVRECIASAPACSSTLSSPRTPAPAGCMKSSALPSSA